MNHHSKQEAHSRFDRAVEGLRGERDAAAVRLTVGLRVTTKPWELGFEVAEEDFRDIAGELRGRWEQILEAVGWAEFGDCWLG
ncbi:hypothetical protein L484_002492 [Morus notabilis]|uniref:Uncharacterized protein n=1 Tax=Morus notabilis TaxID=981085 RepID=W9SHT3_9ROSA|nr:hypothetical protein L484_002492 [Morus notabilis]